MCRWLAYSGSPVSLEELLYKPAHSLIDQSLHSRLGVETTNGDGFGVGWYARTGFEFSAATNTMIGIGARWTDTEIDLGGTLGDLSLQGVQAFVTVTHGL